MNDLDTLKPLRWGIIGTGIIAKALAHALSLEANSVLMGVGSRSQESAESFGDQFSVPNRYGSYEALVQDPEIDVVYISTPHPMHYENTLMCLEAGKAVLCEKPFAMNARETAAMIQLAREKNLFLMEAMWTRFLPAIVKLRDVLAEGVIGELRQFQADFGFKAKVDPEWRLFNKALGGGALLDIGIYPLSFASMVFGTPDTLTSTVHIGATGVDEQFAVSLHYPEGKIGSVAATFLAQTPTRAFIAGSEGQIYVHPRFYKSESITVMHADGREHNYHLPIEESGYRYQVREVEACMGAGERESKIMPLDETLSIMQTLDRIREPWGLVYPSEE